MMTSPAAEAAAAAYAHMIENGYYSQAIIDTFHASHLDVARADTEFRAHRIRDEAEWAAVHRFDPMSLNPTPQFGPDNWSTWTRDAHHRLQLHLDGALGRA